MTTSTRPSAPTYAGPVGPDAELAASALRGPAGEHVGGPNDGGRTFVGRLFDAIAHYRYHVRSL